MPSSLPSKRSIRFWRTTFILSTLLVVGGPLYGLIGTVFGMIRAFDDIKVHGTGDSEKFSSGIATALETTSIGIVISLVALIPFVISLVLVIKHWRQGRHLANQGPSVPTNIT